MENVTLEQTQELANYLKEIVRNVRALDLEVLKASVVEMERQHSFRESASILSPNPFTVHEQNDLDGQKLKSLRLIRDLAESQSEVIKAEIKLANALASEKGLGNLFGL